jgi:hypothetical protein
MGKGYFSRSSVNAGRGAFVVRGRIALMAPGSDVDSETGRRIPIQRLFHGIFALYPIFRPGKSYRMYSILAKWNRLLYQGFTSLFTRNF